MSESISNIDVVKKSWINRVHVDESGSFSTCDEFCDDCFWFDHLDVHAIPESALLRAKQLSTTFTVSGRSKVYTYYAPTDAAIQFLASRPEIPAVREKLERERREEATSKETARQKADDERRKKAGDEAKEKGWLDGKEYLVIPESSMKYTVIEEIVRWRLIAGSSFTELIRFTDPPELAGIEGVHVANHDYDTHYDTYYAAADIAERVNDEYLATAWIKKKAQLLSDPGEFDVESALRIGGEEGFTDYTHCAGHVPQEKEFFADPKNRDAVFAAFKVSFVKKLREKEIREYSDDHYNQRIADRLGMKEEIDAIIADRDEKRRNGKADRDQKAREDRARKDAERAAKLQSLRAKRDAFIASISSMTKADLLSKFGIECRLMKSWDKKKLLDKIAACKVAG